MKDVLSVAKVEDFDGNQEGHASVRSSGLLRLGHGLGKFRNVVFGLAT